MTLVSSQNFIKELECSTCQIIDVRSEDEVKALSFSGAVHHELDRIEKGDLPKLDPNQTTYVLCRSGKRSQRACEILKSQGFKNIYSVEGGILACQSQSGRVQKRSSTLPLMRQVMLAAGVLVLTGLVLSYSVHPYFFGVAVFVGLGLIFSGLTGYCGMAYLLQLMPWNKVKSCDTRNHNHG